MYSDYFSVNKNFQTSINLSLDFNNEEKISEYIPTTDICDVLKKYINNVLGFSKNRSTTLVGPYGKGKSFLLLVLIYLLGGKRNSKVYSDLLIKIKMIDADLYKLIGEINEKNIKFLPIIINSNYENLTQSFRLGLNDALKREQLDNLIPKTGYTVCLNLLKKWNQKKELRTVVAEKCLKVNHINLQELTIGLENYSVDSYNQFVNLYNCINNGLDFNPLVNDDVCNIYIDINHQIIKYGYTGMFIMFDEFSKFLDSDKNNLTMELKLIQDFAEIANRSDKREQINLCCITHKSLNLYLGKKKDAFKTVEGRFKEIKFNRSLDENYQIISAAISKNNSKKIINSFISENSEFYNEINDLEFLNDKKMLNVLIEGCFPLNPLTAFSLVQLSEIVAQNERTLFTFLADTDDNSFNSFINKTGEGLFNVDNIYDYFSSLLRVEETNFIRDVWYQTEATLSKIEEYNQKRIVKVLAVILMINDYAKLVPSEKVIAICLQLDLNIVKNSVDGLLKKHLLRRNSITNQLSFASSNSKEIDDKLNILYNTKLQNISLEKLADEILEDKYLLPRSYNAENKITRFYKVLFLSEDSLNNLNSFDLFFNQYFCDGIVFYLIKEKMSTSSIKLKMNEINDPRAIIKYPSQKIDVYFKKNLYKYAGLKELLLESTPDELIFHEINLLIEETISDIKILVDRYYINTNLFFSSISNQESFNKILSEVMNYIYNEKTVFNNELINKRNVSSQYQKSSNNIIDWLIDGKKDFPYSPTSPEMTINKSVIISNENNVVIRNILNEMKNRISNSERHKVLVTDIVHKFSFPPYGIRKGILPILLGEAIYELSNNVLLYYQDKEVKLIAENLVKSINNDKYFISFSRGSKAQSEYLNDMLDLFAIGTTNSFRDDTINLCNAMRKYFIGLPQIIRMNTLDNNYLGLKESVVMYKEAFLGFNINPYETLYDLPQNIFNTNKYNLIYNQILEFKISSDFILEKFKKYAADKTKMALDIPEKSSLKMGLTNWLAENIRGNILLIISEIDKNLYNLITHNMSYDNGEAISQISKILLKINVEDWKMDETNSLIEKMEKFKEDILDAKKIKKGDNGIDNLIAQVGNTKSTSMGKLMENAIEGVFEEFSGSVSNEEKVSVLTEILKKIL